MMQYTTNDYDDLVNKIKSDFSFWSARTFI